jgi:dynein heavy chain 2
VEWIKDERKRRDRYEEKTLKPLSRRLNAIQQTRLIGEELQRLMSKDDQSKFKLDRVFTPFENIPVLHTGPFSEPQWVAALAEFDRLLIPVEHHAASQLKSRIFALADRPQLLLAEFRNFPNLLLRRSISHELEAERETLLGQLQAHLEDIRQQFEAHSG